MILATLLLTLATVQALLVLFLGRKKRPAASGLSELTAGRCMKGGASKTQNGIDS
jgi:hypothetical protein